MNKLAGRVSLLFAFLYFINLTHANTEKASFVGPEDTQPLSSAYRQNLQLITPADPTIRASLPVVFPSESRQGEASWYLLANLTPGQRYEWRICWSATQPTNFWIDVFEPKDIDKTNALLDQVTQFSQRRTTTELQDASEGEPGRGALLLRIIAAADFYTTNQTRMQYPPPVDLDIILDPYLANIVPRSLLPTAIYIFALAVGSWFVSDFIWKTINPTPSGKKPHND